MCQIKHPTCTDKEAKLGEQKFSEILVAYTHYTFWRNMHLKYYDNPKNTFELQASIIIKV